MTEDQPALPGNDTMLYREPVDPEAEGVTEIWGKKLETKVVDVNEVPAMLREGWYTHPLLGDHHSADTLEAARLLLRPDPALETATARAEELDAALADANQRIFRLETDLKESTELVENLKASNAELQRDLRAAEDLLASGSNAKPKIGIKSGDKPPA